MNKKGIEKILVTGSSGTIGTALCEALMEMGYKVEGIDIKHNKWSEKVDRITAIGDIRDKNFFSKLPRSDFDMIIPLAANARVYNLVKNPILARDNFEILFNILEFSRLNNVDRFIFASSREVYGNSENFFIMKRKLMLKTPKVLTLQQKLVARLWCIPITSAMA
jgi:nucleoside-diphosphate-sugar epimerase